MLIQEAAGEVEGVECPESNYWCSSEIVVLSVDAGRMSVYVDHLVLEIGCGHICLDGKTTSNFREAPRKAEKINI